MPSILVTVGSTRFDRLVTAVSSPSFLLLMHTLHYTHLTIQHGNSPLPEQLHTPADAHIHIDTYAYKPSLREDIERADLIISHAGAGSILEALRLQKKLLVVVNEDLMDNHQQELGSALHEQGFLVCCNVATLNDTLKARKYDSLTPFPEQDTTRFSSFLDSWVFG